jgi:NADPH:quinone reductase-like Zn-dependent oxidoreductase
MKAIVIDHYGPPQDLRLAEFPTPEPRPGEVLVRVRASSVNAADWHLMRADPFLIRLMFGLRRPRFRILGADVAGEVLAVGPGVTQFKPGDAVFGCLSGGAWGAFAEYVCAPAAALALKPGRCSFEQAAASPLAGMTALQALQSSGGLRPGQTALINGASGGVGTFAVQIAKAMGAEVTAVCSTRNLELARSIGADHAIDYSQADFTQQAGRYDFILGANGYHPIAAYRRALTPTGRYVMAGGAGRQMTEAMLLGPWLSRGGRRMGQVMMKPSAAGLETLRRMLESGQVVPVIDRSYPLAQVPAAIAYLEEGHARGKVVITL